MPNNYIFNIKLYYHTLKILSGLYSAGGQNLNTQNYVLLLRFFLRVVGVNFPLNYST